MSSLVNNPLVTLGLIDNMEKTIDTRLTVKRIMVGIIKWGLLSSFCISAPISMEIIMELTEIIILALLSAIPLRVR